MQHWIDNNNYAFIFKTWSVVPAAEINTFVFCKVQLQAVRNSELKQTKISAELTDIMWNSAADLCSLQRCLSAIDKIQPCRIGQVIIYEFEILCKRDVWCRDWDIRVSRLKTRLRRWSDEMEKLKKSRDCLETEMVKTKTMTLLCLGTFMPLFDYLYRGWFIPWTVCIIVRWFIPQLFRWANHVLSLPKWPALA